VCTYGVTARKFDGDAESAMRSEGGGKLYQEA